MIWVAGCEAKVDQGDAFVDCPFDGPYYCFDVSYELAIEDFNGEQLRVGRLLPDDPRYRCAMSIKVEIVASEFSVRVNSNTATDTPDMRVLRVDPAINYRDSYAAACVTRKWFSHSFEANHRTSPGGAPSLFSSGRGQLKTGSPALIRNPG
jgi:hypothetical protein